MKSVPKLIRHFASVWFVGSVVLILLNFILLYTIADSYSNNSYPYQTAEKAAKSLKHSENGYKLSKKMTEKLNRENIWAVFIDNYTLKAVWHTDNLPDTVPESYTASGIAELTRGYIDGYPSFTGKAKDGLMVLGYPKDSFWKHMWPSWDLSFISDIPKILVTFAITNILLIFLIYIVTNSTLVKAIKPVITGIQKLPAGEPVHVKETGLLSEVAANINRTSEFLQSQNYYLHRKETARANWIAGISHDIRTPLSMVMGYASQLMENADLAEEERQKAAVIVKQSRRIKNLINDLNLASKLEYNMQPLNLAKENIVAVVRQTIADFMNMDICDKYTFELETDIPPVLCNVNIDKELIKRAINNLIWNSINHNEQGCKIFVKIATGGEKQNYAVIEVYDDGVGATDEQIYKINNTPHYMFRDESATKQRHGLGLLIVKQIASSHGGSACACHSPYGGFMVKIMLPL